MRQQTGWVGQLPEGWFETISEVPKYAKSLTIHAIMNSRVISCVVVITEIFNYTLKKVYHYMSWKVLELLSPQPPAIKTIITAIYKGDRSIEYPIWWLHSKIIWVFVYIRKSGCRELLSPEQFKHILPKLKCHSYIIKNE